MKDRGGHQAGIDADRIDGSAKTAGGNVRKGLVKRSNETVGPDQAAMAAKAMAVKEAGTAPPDHPPAGEQAAEGFNSVPRPDYPPSGAFDAEGQRPVLERSRKER